MKILFAEDETDLREVVTAYLEYQGYTVIAVCNGQEALGKAKADAFDAMVLDVMMPVMDGITAMRRIREAGNLSPAIFLTAKSQVSDRVEGLDAGADDYLPKPFAMKELLARVNAMTRRKSKYSGSFVTYADFSLNTETLELAAENSVRLSMKECELLHLFVLHGGKEITTDFILEHVWRGDDSADDSTVYLYVKYLNRKLSGIGAAAEITGERSRAYVLLSK